jgi:hypothetical protein
MADKGGQIYRLTSVPTTEDSSRTLQGTKIRDLSSGCSYDGQFTDGLTMDGQWRYAPAISGTPASQVSGSGASSGSGTSSGTGTGASSGAGAGMAAPKPASADPTIKLSGSVNGPVNDSLPGSAAAAPSTFTVTDPSKLPPGVSIDSSGNVMGIPTTAGDYAIAVKACNATGCTTGTVSLTIGPDQTPCDQKPATPATTVADAVARADYTQG